MSISQESLARSIHELLEAVKAERKWMMALALTLLFFAPPSILVAGILTYAAFFTPSFN